MIDIDADIREGLSTENFSTSAVFATTPTTTTIIGEFREGSDEIRSGDFAIEAVGPNFTCLTSDAETLGAQKQKMAVTILTRSFKVERIQKVGTGLSVIYLKT